MGLNKKLVELIARLSHLADRVDSPEHQGPYLDSAAASGQVKRNVRLEPAERAALAEVYRQGSTVLQLVAMFEVSRTTVLTILDQQGVRRRYRKLGPAQLRVAVRLYKAGWSFARVGKDLGLDAGTVHKAFVRAGIPTRPRVGR